MKVALIFLVLVAAGLQLATPGAQTTHTTQIDFICYDIEDVTCYVCKAWFMSQCADDCTLEEVAECLSGVWDNTAPTPNAVMSLGVVHTLSSNAICQGRRGMVQRALPFTGNSGMGVAWSIDFHTRQWMTLLGGPLEVSFQFDPWLPYVCSSTEVPGKMSLSFATSAANKHRGRDPAFNCGAGGDPEVDVTFDISQSGGLQNNVQLNKTQLVELQNQRRMFPYDYDFAVSLQMNHPCVTVQNRGLGELRLVRGTLSTDQSMYLIVPRHPEEELTWNDEQLEALFGGCCLVPSNMDYAPQVGPKWVAQLVALGGRTCRVNQLQCEVLEGEWQALDGETTTTLPETTSTDTAMTDTASGSTLSVSSL